MKAEDDLRVVAIHQPNYLPWLGYWVKAALADVLVLYDNCPLSKPSYTTRVRLDDSPHPWLQVPLEKRPLGTKINEVPVRTSEFCLDHLHRLDQACEGLAFWGEVREIIAGPGQRPAVGMSLASYNTALISAFAALLLPGVLIYHASDHMAYAPGPQTLVRLCTALEADVYASGMGAKAYLDPRIFADAGIRAAFIDTAEVVRTLGVADLDRTFVLEVARVGLSTVRDQLASLKARRKRLLRVSLPN